MILVTFKQALCRTAVLSQYGRIMGAGLQSASDHESMFQCMKSYIGSCSLTLAISSPMSLSQ